MLSELHVRRKEDVEGLCEINEKILGNKTPGSSHEICNATCAILLKNFAAIGMRNVKLAVNIVEILFACDRSSFGSDEDILTQNWFASFGFHD